jgi:signal transduction histidine kinase/transcriptional regulator with GAF, ATPase, and Fis domain
MVAGITEDITERITIAESGVRLREFERLLQEVTNSFVKAPVGRLSHMIDEALARLGAFADVERVGIYETDSDLTSVSGTHEWCAPGIPGKMSSELQNVPLEDLPFLAGQMRDGRTLAMESIDDLPELSEAERHLLENLGVRSRMQVPLVSGDTILGIMILVTTTRTRRWSVEETAMLRVAGDVISGAIAKERSERVQDRRLELEQLFAQLANEFMNLPPGELDAGIAQALDRVATAIGGNRAGLYLLTASGKDAELESSWWAPGTESIPEEFRTFPADKGSMFGDWLASGEPFLIAAANSLESENAVGADGLRKRNVGAVVSAPLRIDGKPVGWIALANWAPRTGWTDDELALVAIAAGVFSNMVARKRAEAERSRSDQMERVLSEFATTLINGPIDGIDDSLIEILSQLGRFCGSERTGLFLYDHGRSTLVLTHDWVSDGSDRPAVLNEAFSVARSDWNFLDPDQKEETWQGRATDLGTDDAATRAMLDSIGITSFCSAKVATAERFYGILALGSTTADFSWPQETALVLRAAAGIAASVLEKRDHMEESTRHQHALAHALRVGSMGQLATGLAHELNQPLTAISNYTTACNRRLRDGNIDNDELTDILQRVTGQALRAGDIIRKLRAHVSKGGMPRKLEEINKLVERSLALLAVEARESRVELIFSPAEELPRVSVDATEIEQVIINLVRNGIESIRDANSPKREVRVETSLQGKNLQVAVSDSGPGFSEADERELFNQFHTTKDDGMGLGLAISRFLIRAHGGNIEASSGPGGGAVFRFLLPAAIVQN